MDVEESKDAVEVTVELPGMTTEDVKIAFEDDMLTISGEKKAEKTVKQADCRLTERSYGTFTRSITLPHSVDAEKITASMADGVLKIVAPKNGISAAKTIAIQAVKPA